MTRCSVKNCRNSVSFKFPSDPIIRQEWLKNIGKPSMSVKYFNGLCREHFRPTDFTHQECDLPYVQKFRLLPFAIPTVFESDLKESDRDNRHSEPQREGINDDIHINMTISNEYTADAIRDIIGVPSPDYSWSSKLPDGLIENTDGKATVMQNLEPVIRLKKLPYIYQRPAKPLKKIRVLSVFDGISAAYQCLKDLKVGIAKYYASEIDRDAIVVATWNHPNIHQLGDILTLTRENIKDICPIDLLVGGSPCNDLSSANPYRLGLQGQSVKLFNSFLQIKRWIEQFNGPIHLFWMFENVNSMSSTDQTIITHAFNIKPLKINAITVSPMHRKRLFWTNITSIEPQTGACGDLQEYLEPLKGRKAIVKTINTITTNVNSLKQGPHKIFPVEAEGQNSSLWISEIENLFGFPKHYTDCNRLSCTKRQQLLGRSWSVRTVKVIFNNLCNYYQSVEGSES